MLAGALSTRAYRHQGDLRTTHAVVVKQLVIKHLDKAAEGGGVEGEEMTEAS